MCCDRFLLSHRQVHRIAICGQYRLIVVKKTRSSRLDLYLLACLVFVSLTIIEYRKMQCVTNITAHCWCGHHGGETFSLASIQPLMWKVPTDAGNFLSIQKCIVARPHLHKSPNEAKGHPLLAYICCRSCQAKDL